MSSMLKKTGGLSFKPKVAPRRAGGAASSSQAPPTSSSTNATPAPATPAAPTAENSSQELTPAPAAPSPAPSVEQIRKPAPTHEATKEKPQEAPQEEVSRQPTQIQNAPSIQPETRPASTPAVAPAIVDKPSNQAPPPTPSPTQKATHPTPTPAVSQPSQPLPSVSAPAIQRTAQPTLTPETTSSDRATPATSSDIVSTNSYGPAAAIYTPTPEPIVPTQTRTAPPSPAPASDTIAVSAPAGEPSTSAPKKKRVYRKRKSTENGTDGEATAPKRRRTRKNTTPEDNGTASTRGAGGRSGPREHSSSPEEDPENQTVDHSSTKMGELTKDMGIGKRFKHADAIEERAREARQRFRIKQQARRARLLGLDLNDELSRASTPAEDGDNGRESAAARARELGASIGANSQSVGYEVVDGQIIVNQQSLMVDRHAVHDIGTLETVEEDEFSRLTTSSSYRRESRRTGANHWTDEDTEKFYRLLGMFGTDFETISAMFPEKSRRAVKLKFNREERLRPRYINATVMVRGEKKIGIDLEEYKMHQHGWQESDKIMAEHDKLVREHNEDIRRLKEERRAAGLIDEEEEGDQQGKEGAGEKGDAGNAEEGDNGDNENDDDENEVVEDVPAEASTEVAVEA
ncbi:hypothetical protein F5B19DRAFT_444899 [Rostrohypoxylon terebratum]|nr:hypothetical protein F5B19DRAFT_444899 [Rostrohypoxylon terebratum]